MQQNPRNAGLPPQQDEVTVHIPRGGRPTAPAQALPDDGVTVLVPGAMLAPAPSPQVVRAGEAPVFVDDSGGRKRLLRLAGVLIALLSIGFIGIVGVALAVPNVATSVGLGKVLPFVVPGAAALPPPKAPPTSQVQVAPLKPKAKPVLVAAPTTEPAPVDVDNPTPDPTPDTTAPATTAPATPEPTVAATVTVDPVTQDPGGAPTGGTPVQGGQAPVVANPPAAVPNAVDANAVAPGVRAP